jgi:hypothetical protein
MQSLGVGTSLCFQETTGMLATCQWQDNLTSVICFYLMSSCNSSLCGIPRGIQAHQAFLPATGNPRPACHSNIEAQLVIHDMDQKPDHDNRDPTSLAGVQKLCKRFRAVSHDRCNTTQLQGNFPVLLPIQDVHQNRHTVLLRRNNTSILIYSLLH